MCRYAQVEDEIWMKSSLEYYHMTWTGKSKHTTEAKEVYCHFNQISSSSSLFKMKVM